MIWAHRTCLSPPTGLWCWTLGMAQSLCQRPFDAAAESGPVAFTPAIACFRKHSVSPVHVPGPGLTQGLKSERRTPPTIVPVAGRCPSAVLCRAAAWRTLSAGFLSWPTPCLGPEHCGCLLHGPSSPQRRGEKSSARALPSVWPARQRSASSQVLAPGWELGGLLTLLVRDGGGGRQGLP